MSASVPRQVLRFNGTYSLYNSIYQKAIKDSDLPAVTFWLLYTLRKQGPCSQKVLLNRLRYPKQSLSSALKMPEKEGYVLLEPSKADRRSKIVHLSPKGEELVQDRIDQIIQAENAAFLELGPKERDILFLLFSKLCQNLQEKMPAYIGGHIGKRS